MPRIDRRHFIKSATAVVGSVPLLVTAQPPEESGPRVLSGPETMDVRVTLNGRPAVIRATSRTLLVDALREQMGLTGTKIGCGHGACGACTVHKDRLPVLSCLTLAADVEGSHLTTVEGLSSGDVLHPVQQAFVDADALQCGFCTPGLVMSCAAFVAGWQGNPVRGGPSPEDLCKAMSGNLCRCGAHAGILRAARAACLGQTAEPLEPASQERGGVPRFDGVEKVRGTARYTVDQYPKGVLFGEVLRSPHAHAHILVMDVKPALAMPGVRAAIILLPKHAGRFTTVRYVGMELVAVAAETAEQAKNAAEAVVVKYQVLPCAIDRDAAEQPGAPLVFAKPEGVPSAAEGLALPEQLFKWEGNVRGPLRWPLHREDPQVDQELSQSAIVVKERFETWEQVHTTLEPHACVAHFNGSTLEVFASTQSTEQVQADLAEALDIPAARIRVHAEYVGGAFGAKVGLKPEQLAACKLSMETRAPVRVVLNRADELTVGGHRAGTRQDVALGADAKGRLQVISHRVRAYAGIASGERAVGITTTLYPVPLLHEHDVNVLTHTAPACAFRAPAAPPRAFAMEQAVDAVAAQLGVDPLLMRLHQEPHARRAAVMRLARGQWSEPERLAQVAQDKGRFVRGVGCAVAEWFVVSAPALTVELRAFRDGTVRVESAIHDMGNGARSVISQILHNELGLAPARMVIKVGNSALPPGIGAFGSITTASVAPALHQAIAHLKIALGEALRPKHRTIVPENNGLRLDGRFVAYADLLGWLPRDPLVTRGERAGDRGGYALPPPPLDALGLFPTVLSKDNASSVQIVEVEVDKLLGRVRVLRVLVALDAGRIIHPVMATSQVAGGVIQGISGVLYEGRRVDIKTGRILSRSLESYAVIGMADVPAIDVHFLAKSAEHNPVGSVGLAENATVATGAALGNAVFRATGQRIATSPITPARLMSAWAVAS
jgi:xanthine dehydrogenase YagR molybdenum-binding subunit